MAEITLLLNGRFFTDNPSDSMQSMAVDQGTIAAIGPTQEILNRYSHPAHKIDLQGQVVLPGLTDSHLHLALLADHLNAVECETDSIEQCLENVAEAAESKPQGTWIIGYGWNHNAWVPAEYGSAALLDRVSNNHPVVLHAKSLHASWVNSAALGIAGITADTPDPEGGQILRDDLGQPTGILLENAMGLVDRCIPERSIQELLPMLEHAQQHLFSLGITTVHDFDRMACFRALQQMDVEGKLLLRVRKNLPGEMLAEIAASNWKPDSGTDQLFAGSLKFFSDGALGPQSAAMLLPYENSASRGMLLMNAQEVFEQGKKAAQHGWPLAIHAIGDAANRAVLDGYQMLRDYETDHNLPHLPHRIEHVQIIDPADQSRLNTLEVIASVQPVHATSDMFMAEKYWGERCAHAYAYNSLKKQGAVLIFGSDAPVESPNPFLGIHAAVTRRRTTGEPGSEGWYPAQRLTLQDALAAFTINPARSCGKERSLGKIAVGYKADLIVLPCDPFNIPSQELCKVLPDMTLLDGNIVFSR